MVLPTGDSGPFPLCYSSFKSHSSFKPLFLENVWKTCSFKYAPPDDYQNWRGTPGGEEGAYSFTFCSMPRQPLFRAIIQSGPQWTEWRKWEETVISVKEKIGFLSPAHQQGENRRNREKFSLAPIFFNPLPPTIGAAYSGKQRAKRQLLDILTGPCWALISPPPRPTEWRLNK